MSGEEPGISRRCSWGTPADSLPYEELIEQVLQKSARLQEAESALSLMRKGSEKLKNINEELLHEHQLLQDEIIGKQAALEEELHFHKSESRRLSVECDSLRSAVLEKSDEVEKTRRSITETEGSRALEDLRRRQDLEETFANKIKNLESRLQAEKNKALESSRLNDTLRIELMQTTARSEDQLNNQTTLLKQEISRLTNQLSEKNSMLQLKNEAADTAAQLRERLAESLARIKDFNREMANVKSEHDSLINELSRRLSGTEAELSERNFQVVDLKKQVALFESAKAESDKKLIFLTNDTEQKTREIEGLKSEFSNFQVSVKTERENLKRMLESEREAKIVMNKEMEELRIKNVNFHDKSNEEIRALGHKKDLEISSLREKISACEEKSKSALFIESEKTKLSEKQNIELSKKIALIEKQSAEERTHALSKTATLNVEKDKLTFLLTESEKSCRALQERTHEYETLKRDYQTLQHKHRELGNQISTIKQKSDALEMDNTNLKTRIDQQVRGGEDISRSLQQAISDRERLSTELVAAKAAKVRLLDKSKSKIRQIKETVESLGGRLGVALQERAAIEEVAFQNKLRFEEKLVEWERDNLRGSLNALKARNSPPLNDQRLNDSFNRALATL